MRLFDGELGLRRFIAEETFSIADITTKVAVDFGVRFNEVIIPDDVPNFRQCHAEMEARPSSKA